MRRWWDEQARLEAGRERREEQPLCGIRVVGWWFPCHHHILVTHSLGFIVRHVVCGMVVAVLSGDNIVDHGVVDVDIFAPTSNMTSRISECGFGTFSLVSVPNSSSRASAFISLGSKN
jgi:hypothetical protein